MTADVAQASQSIQNSYDAFRKGERQNARYWAQRAVWQAPGMEEAWLILASISTPSASAAYLRQVLKINPKNRRAKIGLRIVQKHLRSPGPAGCALNPALMRALQVPGETQTKASIKKSWFVSSLAAGLVLVLAAMAWFLSPSSSHAQDLRSHLASPSQPVKLSSVPAVGTLPPTERATNEASAATATLVPTLMITVWQPPTPTEIPTSTQQPTLAPSVTPGSVGASSLDGEQRIIVSISRQRLVAYQGSLQVYSFIASTGMDNSTLAGTFQILDKIPNAYSASFGFWMPDWLGIYYVGYDLENGIHSLPVWPNGDQIWGDQIGKPISYGCVVLEPNDAKKLFDWVNVGTRVEIDP